MRSRRKVVKVRAITAKVEDVLAYGFACGFLGLVAMTVVGLLYWVKSAAGIDLMDGHSPFHALFF